MKLITYSKDIFKRISANPNLKKILDFHNKTYQTPVVIGACLGTIYGVVKLDEFFRKKKDAHICVILTVAMTTQFASCFTGAILGYYWPITVPVLMLNLESYHPSLSVVYKNFRDLFIDR